MTRAEFIAQIHALLRNYQREAVVELVAHYGAAYPDVAKRANEALDRIAAGGPVDRPSEDAPAPASPPAVVETDAVAARLKMNAAIARLKPGHYVLKKGPMLRIEQQPATAAFAPNKKIISRKAEDAFPFFQGFGFIEPNGVLIWAKFTGSEREKLQGYVEALAADPKAAGEAYAKVTGRCYICGRTLTDEESIKRGIGPVCLERGY